MSEVRKKGFFERFHSSKIEDMIDYQLKLQVKLSFPKQYDFMLRNGLNECRTVLDYGTGNGAFCCEVAKRHTDIRFDAMDLKEDMISRAKAASKEQGVANIEWIVGSHLHVAPEIPGYLERAGFKSIRSELDGTTNKDIGLETTQELLIREAQLLNHFDPDIMTEDIVQNLTDFMKNELPNGDYLINYGVDMITARK